MAAFGRRRQIKERTGWEQVAKGGQRRHGICHSDDGDGTSNDGADSDGRDMDISVSGGSNHGGRGD